MQITAMYDNKGRILAATEVKLTDTTVARPPAPQPKPKRGQRVGVFTVPPQFAHLDFGQACTQLMVHAKGKHAILKPMPRDRQRKGAAIRN